MADVNVYNVGGSFIDDLGRPALPANIRPFDFSALDKALEAEQDISGKAIDIAMQNVKDMGKIRDDLTNITSPSLYHAAEVEAAKKAIGIDRNTFAQAANNIDDATAMFDVDRKMKKLSADPRVRNAMYDNAVLEAAKMELPKIVDPGLKAIAIKDIEAATNSMDPNAIKNLSMDQYKEVDLEGAYLQALNNFAPYIPTSEQVTADDGTTYTRTVNKRDPEMVAKTRKYFIKNKIVNNNLFAKGYIDENGEATAPKGGLSWFDDVEAPQLVPLESISNVKGASGKTNAAGVGGISTYIPSPELKPVDYISDSYTDDEAETEFDLGPISAVETGGRSNEQVVHVDPSGNALNFGAYSFNGGTGTNFLKYVKESATTPEAISIIDQLLDIPVKSGDLQANAAKARPLYKKLEKELGGTMLRDMERKYAVEEFGNKAVNYFHDQDGLEDYPLTKGDSTLLMDTAIQWGPKTWQGWIKDFSKQEDKTLSLQQFITNKRMALANKLYPKLAQSMNDRAYRIWDAAARIDGANNAGSEPVEGVRGSEVTPPADQSKTTGAFIIDPSEFGQYVDPGVSNAVDSISSGVPVYYTKMKQEEQQQ